MKTLTEQGIPTIDAPDYWGDDFPCIDHVRIWREGSENGYDDAAPWHMDGYVMTFTGKHAAAVLSPGVWDFATHAEAIASVREFIEKKGMDR